MNDLTQVRDRTIEVPLITRVEGEGAIYVKLEGREIRDLQLRIIEPPRFFETFLQGRLWTEVPDITARICGICPVAYQMSASLAIERAFGAQLPPEIEALRRLYYCGEWIESHALHVHLLAAPDFLGYPDAITMAKKFPEEVKRGMHLQGLGNAIVKLFGGRAVNPVGVRPGGFYRAPPLNEVRALLEKVRAALPQAEALIRWTARLPVPEVTRDVACVSLRHTDEYPMARGWIHSSSGVDLDASEFEQRYHEFQVPHSTAFHARLDDQPYWVGPVPRLNNNLDRLPEATARLLEQTGMRWPSRNPYHGVVARAVEIHVALLEAERILDGYRPLAKAHIELSTRAGEGAGCTEAPRGILWHRYRLDDHGYVQKAVITPPTSQNQFQMEEDMRQSIMESLEMDDAALTLRLESGIRNYDPCISCSTHFLRVRIERG